VLEKNEKHVINLWGAVHVARPAKRILLLFLVFELKAESTGGTLWQAENQAAGIRSNFVNILC
jgi:hypothetical protein